MFTFICVINVFLGFGNSRKEGRTVLIWRQEMNAITLADYSMYEVIVHLVEEWVIYLSIDTII